MSPIGTKSEPADLRDIFTMTKLDGYINVGNRQNFQL